MLELWFVVILLGVMLVGLIATRIQASYIFAAAAIAMFLSGFVPLESLAKNFTNGSLLTLVLLMLASCGLEKTRLISSISQHISKGNLASVVAKLGISTAVLSSFTNNTAIVVALIGAIKRNPTHPPSKLLIPLSYAAILGGTLTLIGTSTNLIINSFVVDAGLPSLGFFSPSLIGIAALCVCMCVLIPMSYSLVKQKADEEEDLPYFIEARVCQESPLIGKTIQENKLRSLRQLYLAEVIRDKQSFPSVDPYLTLHADDRLMFCGDVNSVSTLQEIEGLEFFSQHHLDGQNLVEVVVSQSASIRYQSLKSCQFRERFDAIVVAIRRGHEPLKGGLGNIRLIAGDVLVLVPGKNFASMRQSFGREFVFINDLDSSTKLGVRKSWSVISGFMLALGLGITGVLPIINSLTIYLLFLLAIKAVTLGELSRRFPVDIVVIVGAALSLAQLMVSSGVSAMIGQFFMQSFDGFGPMGALVAAYLMTLVMTEFITNNAAAALSFPIALSMAQAYNVDVMPFVMAVLFGASASFISPYGYQTNLLVYRVGGYQLKDYFKMGLPMSLAYSIVVLTLIPIIYPF
ncbi:MAG: SLC13 family permease [Vibrio sp.]